ncbi:MAG: hypothetical protein M3N34_09625 [Pseudomonadota bacterium]|nr:hypothetical protein [Pseudomonadota bacterium]
MMVMVVVVMMVMMQKGPVVSAEGLNHRAFRFQGRSTVELRSCRAMKRARDAAQQNHAANGRVQQSLCKTRSNRLAEQSLCPTISIDDRMPDGRGG